MSDAPSSSVPSEGSEPADWSAGTVEDDKRLANVIAAFALALTDKMNAAIRDASGRGPMTAAAIVQIGFNRSMSIEQLRSIIGLSHSATVRIVDQLQKDGIVRRARLDKSEKGDSRVSHLALTQEGVGEMERILAARRSVAANMLGAIAAEGKAALSAIVDRLLPGLIAAPAEEDTVCRLCDERNCPQDRCPANCCLHPATG